MPLPLMTSQEDIMNFIEAVEQDEYAELELPTGDYLITDWEGDGEFRPYVVPDVESPRDWSYYTEVGDEIAEMLNVEVRMVEYDENNKVFVPWMERPTKAKI